MATFDADTSAQVPPDAILAVATGFMAAKHLFVASEIGLFAALADGPLPLEAIAERTDVPRASVRILTGAMVALGFLALEGDHYRNQPVAQTYLAGQAPSDLRPGLRFFDEVSYPTWVHLEEAIRTRQGVRGALSTERNAIRSHGIESFTAAAAHALSQIQALAQRRRILDLGGGMGFFSRVLVQHDPEREATLFELPAVAAIAREGLARTPEGDRIAVVEGDFFRDPIPPGHDAVLLANVVHLFSPEHNHELLARIRAGAAPGTALLLVDFWTDPSHTQPVFAALMAGEWLTATGEADCYSVAEVVDWLGQTGWSMPTHQPLAGAASLIAAHASETK